MVTIATNRSALYTAARPLGAAQAVDGGTVVEQIIRRSTGSAPSRALVAVPDPGSWPDHLEPFPSARERQGPLLPPDVGAGGGEKALCALRSILAVQVERVGRGTQELNLAVARGCGTLEVLRVYGRSLLLSCDLDVNRCNRVGGVVPENLAEASERGTAGIRGVRLYCREEVVEIVERACDLDSEQWGARVVTLLAEKVK